MMNYVTKRPYSGANAATLAAANVDQVVTFKQAVRDLGVSGKNMKKLVRRNWHATCLVMGMRRAG